MRISRLPRAKLGIATVLAIALTAGFLARTTVAAPPVQAEEPAEPAFLDWEGEPFADGLNHFIVGMAPTLAEPTDGWLVIDQHDHLVTSQPSTPDQVALSELDEAVTGGEQRPLDEVAAVGMLAAREDVTAVRSIGFGLYALAGNLRIGELAQQPGVAAVTYDTGLTAASADPYYPSQWSLENDGDTANAWTVAFDADIDAPEGWHRTRGQGVVVAVIDSGADVTHPDLTANVWRNPGEDCSNEIDDDNNGYVDDCNGWDFANGDPSVDDLVGHGTHVAGIIAAEADNRVGIAGIAYESDLMVLKIGDGTPALSTAIEAIGYALDNGARVINASWVVDDPAAGPYLDAAIAAAEQAGVLFVTGAGNVAQNLDVTPVYPAASSHDNVIVVGASTPTDQPADFSGFGPGTVDLFAPGEQIISTVPGGYGIYSGTSMAAPMVTAAAALLWAATPEATYEEVKGALLDRSDGPNDGLASFRDLAASDGRLNIERAIYTRLFQPSLMYNFYEFNSFEPDVPHKVAITAKTVDPWIVPPQTPAMYRAGLYVPVDGQPMAVVGQEITYTGAGGDITVATDGTGRALVGTVFERQQRPAFVQDGDFTPLAMELPAGTYAFVMEVVDVSDRNDLVGLGDPSAVFFIVNADGTVSEMPELPLGGGPTTTTIPPPAETTTTASPTSAPTSTTVATDTSPTASPTTTTVGQATTTTTATTLAPAATTTTRVPATSTTLPTSTTTTGAPPTTTQGPPTSLPATTTTTPAATTTTAAPADDLAMRIIGVNPDQGPTTGGTLVTITGEHLPAEADVLFAERRGELVSAVAGSFLVVDTPPGPKGTVTVRVIDRNSGETAELPNAFTYTVAGEEPAPTTTTTVTAPQSTTTTGPTTTLAITTTTTAHPTATSTTEPPVSTTEPPLPDTSFDDWLDSVLQTPDGLTLALPADDDPITGFPVELWAGAFCDEPVCPGWVLED